MMRNLHLLFNMKFSPQQILVFSFVCVILTGSVILLLPVSSASSNPVNFIDALFTATSAVCVPSNIDLLLNSVMLI